VNTHETYIQAVRDLAIQHARLPGETLEKLARTKLIYGRGVTGLRGCTQYGAWKNGHDDELVEICAAGEENWIQLAGTTLHELGHVATGCGHGHDKTWRECCAALGLRRVHAAGTLYALANFAPALRFALAALPHPSDGAPNLNGVDAQGVLFTFKTRPCSAGRGVRGGKSHGPGSGSRLRKYVCGCGVIVRASRDNLHATCEDCHTPFHREE
jgi:hypothetical protein